MISMFTKIDLTCQLGLSDAGLGVSPYVQESHRHQEKYTKEAGSPPPPVFLDRTQLIPRCLRSDCSFSIHRARVGPMLGTGIDKRLLISS